MKDIVMTRQEAIAMIEDDKKKHHDELSGRYRAALTMAIEALEQEPIIRCEDCKHHGTSNCSMWGDDTTEDYMWCCDGARMENGE